jgi:hypothetical protein
MPKAIRPGLTHPLDYSRVTDKPEVNCGQRLHSFTRSYRPSSRRLEMGA